MSKLRVQWIGEDTFPKVRNKHLIAGKTLNRQHFEFSSYWSDFGVISTTTLFRKATNIQTTLIGCTGSQTLCDCWERILPICLYSYYEEVRYFVS